VTVANPVTLPLAQYQTRRLSVAAEGVEYSLSFSAIRHARAPRTCRVEAGARLGPALGPVIAVLESPCLTAPDSDVPSMRWVIGQGDGPIGQQTAMGAKNGGCRRQPKPIETDVRCDLGQSPGKTVIRGGGDDTDGTICGVTGGPRMHGGGAVADWPKKANDHGRR
jgi:hypothetical protein